MTPWELAIAGLLYLNVARRYFAHDDVGMAITMTAYSIANIGLMWPSIKALLGLQK
jgi:hypothetical protein